MESRKKYRGVVVPMVTPVTEAGKADLDAVERIVEFFASAGVSPLLMGTTGEGNSVPREEAARLVARTARTAVGRITVYAGLNGCCTQEHIESARLYRKLGADVIVATLPAYYALTPEQMYGYYERLANGIDAPLMLYNIKATTHMSIPVEVVRALSGHPNIVGLKDSERDLDRMTACLVISKGNDGFAYFCGWAAQSAFSLAHGADGIVPSTGNIVPEMFGRLYEAAVSGDVAEAERLQRETDAIAKIYQEGRTLGQSLAALKAMMHVKGLCEPWMLSPLTRLEAEEEREVERRTREMLP